MSEIDWTILFKKYKGEWVALQDDEKTVIFHGKNAKTVLTEAQNTGYKNPIMLKVPEELLAYIGQA